MSMAMFNSKLSNYHRVVISFQTKTCHEQLNIDVMFCLVPTGPETTQKCLCVKDYTIYDVT